MSELETWMWLHTEFAKARPDREFDNMCLCNELGDLLRTDRITLETEHTMCEKIRVDVKLNNREVWLYNLVEDTRPDHARSLYALEKARQLALAEQPPVELSPSPDVGTAPA